MTKVGTANGSFLVLALSPIRRLVFGGRRLSICDRLFPVEYRADGP
jgi:hypothetical protein